MTAGSVPSSAALCALHVGSSASSQRAFEQDLVLQLVLRLAPPLQCRVVRGGGHHHPPPHDGAAADASKPGGASPSPSPWPLRLQVGPHEHENLLLQRNSIVRALCGMGLHSAMDHTYRLLGGHSAKAFRSSSGGANSSTSALALAAIVDWMAVAQRLQEPGISDDDLQSVLGRCERQLEANAYLVPSVPCGTVADYDVAAAILTRPKLLEEAVKGRNTSRWLRQCHAELVKHGIRDICQAAKVTLLAPPAPPAKLPIFYNGTEAAAAAAAVAPAPTKAAKAPPSNSKETKAAAANEQNADPKPPNASADSKKSDKKAAEAAAKAAAEAASASAAAAADPSAAAPSAAPAAEYNVGALDIRVGKIVQVWEHETADKLYCEVVDLGSEQRKIASGLRPFYSLQDMESRRVLVLCNLKARNLIGFPSHGMVLCASNDDHTSVEFVVPPDDAPLGSRVVFDGYEASVPEPESKVNKKKIFEAVAPDLRTNESGQVVWKGALGRVEGADKNADGGGVVKALNGMPNARVS